MARRYRKVDIDRRTDNGYGAYYPAVNVKSYHFPSAEQVMAEWPGTDEATAQKALEFAYDMAQRIFWEYWQDTTGGVENGLYGNLEYAFFKSHNNRLTVDCQGRSGGWLVVLGLPPVEEWDAIMVSAWSRFEKAVKEDVTFRTSWESVKEDIEANEWYKPYSSQYNFCETAKGNICLADARADLMAIAEEKYDGAAHSLVIH
jgi:hypothetical protein